MSFIPATNKLDAVKRIAQSIQAEPETLGPGSKERKSVLIKLAKALGVVIGNSTSKHKLAEEIAGFLTTPWTSDCFSEGQTITLHGLNVLLEASTTWFLTHSVQRTLFPYTSGDTFKRHALHSIVGGSFRTGMTSCLGGSEFLLFHDKKAGKEFGYDKWDGMQADGSFAYTGQGLEGPQKMKLGNQGLMKAGHDGLPIRLLESVDGKCTYLGQFILGDPPFTIRRAPDIKGVERDVYVFYLIPVSKDNAITSLPQVEQTITGSSRNWTPPNYEDFLVDEHTNQTRNSSRLEHALQAALGEFLVRSGEIVENHDFEIFGLKGTLRPDLWIKSMNLVVEAKVSSARYYVRIGIGQVLDYANLSALEGSNFLPALLLPSTPSKDLSDLVHDLGIVLITPTETGFQFTK